jgi:hypothetical protein
MSSAAGGVPGDHQSFSPHLGPFADTVHQTLASTNRRRPGLNPSTTHEQGLGKVWGSPDFSEGRLSGFEG